MRVNTFAVRFGVLAACVLFAGSVAAQESKEGQSSEQAGQQSEQSAQGEQGRQKRKLRVYELEHRTANQMVELIRLRSDAWRAEEARRAAKQARTSEHGEVVVPVAVAPSDVDTGLIVAHDPLGEERLFVRGREDRIKEVDELVKAFDVPDDQLQEKSFGSIRVVPVYNEPASSVRGLLTQLEIQADALDMGNAGLLILRIEEEGDESLDQVKEILAKLEVNERKDDREDDREEAADAGEEDRSADADDDSVET